MSGYSDAEQVTKLNKRMSKAVDSNEIALECEFIMSVNVNEKIIPELSQAMIDGFSSYEPDPNVPTLIRCSIRHEKDDFYQEKFFILNPEGYMPPDEITTSEIENLTGLVAQEIAQFQDEKKNDLDKYKVTIDLYAVYKS